MPEPQSNVEKYLSVVAGHSSEVPSQPASRVEYYLNEIVKNGGIGGKLRPEIVSSLPQTGESGLLYLVPGQNASGQNLHNEYIWIEEESGFELIGQTNIEIDLTGYVPNSRRVGGIPLSSDVDIQVTATDPIVSTNTSNGATRSFEITHKVSGVTAGSKGNSANQTPEFGDTFKTLHETVDEKGHVTALSEKTVKIPATKVTMLKDGLMSKEDKAKLDKVVPKGSASKGIYIDSDDNPVEMTYKLEADVPSGFATGTAVPLMDGTAAVGNSVKYAHEDHVHPTDTSRASAADVTALESENALLRELINGIDAPIYRTASGNPAIFTDGYPANVRALSVTLTPTQSGTGDPSPSNVRPISGVDSVTVTRTGENGADPQSVTVTLTDGSDPLTVYGGTLNVTTGELTVTYRTLMLDGSLVSSAMPYKAGFPGAWLNSSVNEMSTYPAYNPNSTEWNTDFSLCDMIPVEANPYSRSVRGVCIRNITGLCVRLAASDIPDFSDTSDGSAIKAAIIQFLNNKKPTLVYRLATPVTYQLTPAQLATLSGYNAVSTDAGTLSVTYRADTALSLGGSA